MRRHAISREWLWSSADIDAGHFRRYTRALLPLFLLRAVPYRLGFRGRRDDEVEHASRTGWLSAVLRSMLAREVVAIANRRSIVTGTSCVLVARKASGITRGTQ